MAKQSKNSKKPVEEVEEEELPALTEDEESKEEVKEESSKEVEKVEEQPVAEEKEEAEEKVETVKKKKKEEEIVEERVYTIPLQKALVRPPKKRSPRAMQLVKAFIIKHMKLDIKPSEDEEELPQLSISKEVNEKIWSKGIEKPPRKIRVRATKDKDGNITVYLAET